MRTQEITAGYPSVRPVLKLKLYLIDISSVSYLQLSPPSPHQRIPKDIQTGICAYRLLLLG